MRRLLIWTGRGLAILAALVLLLLGVRAYAMHRFVADWQARFPSYKDDIGRLPAVDLAVGLPGEAPAPEPFPGAKLVKYRFPDGSWFAAAEHDTHDEGLEWDRTVFFDSRGRSRVSRHHFCGWEGLLSELTRPAKKARSVDEFFEKAAAAL